MTYRVFMTIQRGTMDKTAVCVFPWERPLLEEIHGGGAEVVGIEEMSSLKGASKVVPVKLKPREMRLDDGTKKLVQPEIAPHLKEQFEAMAKVSRDDDPFHNLDEEYGRLIDKYGMHPEVKMSVAEKVFGSIMNFRNIVRAYRGNTPPKIDPLYPDMEEENAADDGGAVDFDPLSNDLAPAELDRDQVKAALDARSVPYAKNAKTEALADLLTEAITQPA